MTPQTINDQTWAAIRAEFTLPALAQVHHRLCELMEDQLRTGLDVLDKDGTRPQRAINNRRSREPSSRRSAMMSTSWVGAICSQQLLWKQQQDALDQGCDTIGLISSTPLSDIVAATSR